MNNPPYVKQIYAHACSLAVLRMVLARQGVMVDESELIQKVENDYGKSFTNIRNTSIAKLATTYGLKTTIYALKSAKGKKGGGALLESLSVADKDMLAAAQLGCEIVYGRLAEKEIKTSLAQGKLIQTSVKLQFLYPTQKGFHSILLYAVDQEKIKYHDPYCGAALEVNIAQLLKAMSNTGPAILYG